MGGNGLGRNGRCSGEPIPFWPRSPSPSPSALGLIPTPPANGGHPVPGGDAGSANYPVDESTRPGLRMASVDGDDMWRGQKEGSVTNEIYNIHRLAQECLLLHVAWSVSYAC